MMMSSGTNPIPNRSTRPAATTSTAFRSFILYANQSAVRGVEPAINAST